MISSAPMLRVVTRGLVVLVAVLCWPTCGAFGQGESTSDDSPLGFVVGTLLGGGYSIVELGPSDRAAVRVGIDGPEGYFRIGFGKRDDRLPAYTRTEHCNVSYELAGSSASTPTSVGLAIEALADHAAGKDAVCDGLASASGALTPPTGGTTVSRIVTFAVPFLVVFVLLWLLGGLGERRRRVAFGVCCVALGLAAGWLRFWGWDAPFVESASTQRIQVGAAGVWDILTFRTFDYRHPPLTAIVLHVALWFGHTERVLRAAFCLSSTLSLLVLMVMTRKLAGLSAAIGVGAITAILVPVVLAGWDIGSHALFALVAPTVLLQHHRLIERPTRRNAVVLGVANGIALWTHYFAPFLLLVQALDLVTRYVTSRSPRVTNRPDDGARRGLLTSLLFGVVIGVLPLLFLVKSMVLDRQVHAISQAAPDAVWGVSQVPSMVADAAHLIGPVPSLALLVFAVIGTTLLYVDRQGDQERRALVWVAVYAWSVPAAVLLVSPLQRMRDFYLVLSLPFLVVLAVVAAARLPGWLASKLGPTTAQRWALITQRAATPLLIAAVVAVAFGHLATRGLDDLESRRYDHRTLPVAQAIRESGLQRVAIVHGNSQTLLGYYLTDDFSTFDEAQLTADHWRYGDHHIHALTTPDQLGPHWRTTAEQNLETLLTTHGPLALVDWDDGEETWPKLEQRGHCSLLSSFTRARLLSCSPN